MVSRTGHNPEKLKEDSSTTFTWEILDLGPHTAKWDWV